jgi:hypothetical protein
MGKLIPVSKTDHAGKKWRRPSNYSFVAGQPIVPLVSGEFSRVAVSMPIAFVAAGGRYVPVAIMSPITGRNLFVGPSGQWLGTYVPATLAAYPFRFSRLEGRAELVLCIDEDSIAPDGIGLNFFDPNGKFSSEVTAVLELLKSGESGRALTENAMVALAEADLIQPWPIKISMDGAPAGAQITAIGDLYRVDEARLNALSDELFLRLRKSSALPLAYLQLLSMGQISLFPQLVRLQEKLSSFQQQQRAPVQQLPLNLDEFFAAAENETVRFK